VADARQLPADLRVAPGVVRQCVLDEPRNECLPDRVICGQLDRAGRAAPFRVPLLTILAGTSSRRVDLDEARDPECTGQGSEGGR
jgi:hypothetical protein